MKLLVLSACFVIFAGAKQGTDLPPPFTEECVSGTYPPKNRPKIPTYTINLDLPGEQRWTKITKDKGKEIVALITQFKEFLRIFGGASDFIIELVDKHLGSLVDTMPAPYSDEIRGIAKGTGLPLGEAVLYNIFYEVFSVCTSIVAQDSNGTLFHARNLDFGLFMGWDANNHSWAITEFLRPLIVQLDFQKSGKTVYKSVNFAGYIGILTAVKPGIFTFTMNERFDLLHGGYLGILKWILGDHRGQWMGFLAREVLENAKSYSAAQKQLANTPMLAPAYFILGGNKTGQASIITRVADKALDIWELDISKGMWYLVETNFDHWKEPPFYDNRRKPAKTCMDKLTQKKLSIAGLFDVLSSKPVLNKLTTYTALMQVNSGHLEVYLQYCPDPCWAW